MNINWQIIADLEGGSRRVAYVPQDKKGVIGKSGVTVGKGIDLGQRNRAEIEALDIPKCLKIRLQPYCGHKKEEAVAFLKSNPLHLTEQECEALNLAVTNQDTNRLVSKFNTFSKQPFDSIPWQAQTVLASLAWNFGPNLDIAIPSLFTLAIKGDWQGLAKKLESFQGVQAQLVKRRKKEAEILKGIEI